MPEPAAAQRLDADAVLAQLGSTLEGLSEDEAARRLILDGPNALRTHKARPGAVLVRQLRSPLLVLLLSAATVSFFVGQRTDAVIVGLIVLLSVGLGFLNEFRAERATEALHSQLRHRALVRRDGTWRSCDVVELVAGDIVRLELGEVVPADLRLTRVTALECDESVLTGESMPVELTSAASPRASGASPDIEFQVGLRSRS